jgi:hypothetical protein
MAAEAETGDTPCYLVVCAVLYLTVVWRSACGCCLGGVTKLQFFGRGRPQEDEVGLPDVPCTNIDEATPFSPITQSVCARYTAVGVHPPFPSRTCTCRFTCADITGWVSTSGL